MAKDDDAHDEFNDAELDRLFAVYNGRGLTGIGVQARDRLIRKLIDERARRGPGTTRR